MLIKLFKIYLFIAVVIFIGAWFTESSNSAGSKFRLEIRSICGNNIKEWDEQCDGPELGGATCISLGFNSGSVSCTPSCLYDTSDCEIIIPPPSGGGGGGGGSWPIIPPVTQTTLIFSGFAYPSSQIILLKDGQQATSTVAGNDGSYKITLSGLSGGHYIFALYAKDSTGRLSSPLSFSFNLVTGTMTEVKNAVLPPTLDTDKTEVKKGDSITFFGQSVPNSEVHIKISGDKTIVLKTIADITGRYSVVLNTSVLEMGQEYTAEAMAFYLMYQTIDSNEVKFKIGEETIEKKLEKEWKCGDLNEDWLVNLVDFSIAAFWYKKPLNETIRMKERQVLNGDGVIDIADFSIMAYCWTG